MPVIAKLDNIRWQKAASVLFQKLLKFIAVVHFWELFGLTQHYCLFITILNLLDVDDFYYSIACSRASRQCAFLPIAKPLDVLDGIHFALFVAELRTYFTHMKQRESKQKC